MKARFLVLVIVFLIVASLAGGQASADIVLITSRTLLGGNDFVDFSGFADGTGLGAGPGTGTDGFAFGSNLHVPSTTFGAVPVFGSPFVSSFF